MKVKQNADLSDLVDAIVEKFKTDPVVPIAGPGGIASMKVQADSEVHSTDFAMAYMIGPS